MTWLAGIGVWFGIAFWVGPKLGKFIKRSSMPDAEEMWSIHHGGGMQ